MIILSYNIRDLVTTHKRNSLRRLVIVHKLEVLLLQETRLEAEKANGILFAAFPRWSFVALIVEGRS
jgi:exonuclease III